MKLLLSFFACKDVILGFHFPWSSLFLFGISLTDRIKGYLMFLICFWVSLCVCISGFPKLVVFVQVINVHFTFINGSFNQKIDPKTFPIFLVFMELFGSIKVNSV